MCHIWLFRPSCNRFARRARPRIIPLLTRDSRRHRIEWRTVSLRDSPHSRLSATASAHARASKHGTAFPTCL